MAISCSKRGAVLGAHGVPEILVELQPGGGVDRTERVHGHCAPHPGAQLRSHSHDQESAPRVPDYQGVIPAEMIQNGRDILDMLVDPVWAGLGRGSDASLLVPRHAVASHEFVGEGVEVVPGHGRPPMEQQHRRPFAGHPADEIAPRHGNSQVSPLHPPDATSAVSAGALGRPAAVPAAARTAAGLTTRGQQHPRVEDAVGIEVRLDRAQQVHARRTDLGTPATARGPTRRRGGG